MAREKHIDEDTTNCLRRIREICRDGQLLTAVKILEIYCEATRELDRLGERYLLGDMRSGRK